MDELDKLMADAERVASRVTLLAQQEAALKAVTPQRFDANMAAFAAYLPEIAKTFTDYAVTRPFTIFCNENGIPNIKWQDSNVSLYGDDPYSECQKQITSILESDFFTRPNFGQESNPVGFIHVDFMNRLAECNENAAARLKMTKKVPDYVPLVIMFGCGLGYQLGYLYEQCRVDNLFLFEPDLDVFYASLFCFDWAPLLTFLHDEKLGLHIFLGHDEKNIMSDFNVAIHARGAFMATNALLCWHYPSPEIFKIIEQVRKEFYQLMMGWGFYDDNIIALSHCAENLDKQVPFLLRDKVIAAQWQSTPVFLIANGPSLDASIEYIRSQQQRVLLVSCGSTISALHKAGIKPDIHVETERTKAVPDFLALLEDPDYLRDILFISSDVIHPDCTKFFKRAGLFFKFDEPSAMLCGMHFPEARERAHLSGTNPLVANIGLKTVCSLGFKNIYLFGMDNGYRTKSHHHSRLSAYFDQAGNPVEQLMDIVVGGSDYAVPANFGGHVYTNAMFDTCRLVLGLVAKEYKDATICNCSDGAKIENTYPLESDKILLKNTGTLPKQALLDHIYSDLFAVMDIDREAMRSHLDIAFFDELIDRLILEWDEPFTSREQVSSLMQRQYYYMYIIAGSSQRHIHKMLIGTLNYVFSLVSVSLYRFESLEDTMQVVRELICIIQDYFREAKNMYPASLDSVDRVDNSVISLFRKTEQ